MSPSQSDEPVRSHQTTTDANRLRSLLQRAGLSQRAAAKLLNVDERMMRQWCAGQGSPPPWIFRGLSPKLTHTESLRRSIEKNESVIQALRDGRIVDLGFGPERGSAESVEIEVSRLRRRNEENAALIRQDEAFDRLQEMHFLLNEHWLPRGSGTPPAQLINNLEEAEAEFRASKAEVDRIVSEIRNGTR